MVAPPHDPPRDVLVVGAGLAGVSTVAALRRAGYDGHVRVLGAELGQPYDRPPLSKHLLDRDAPTLLAAELGLDLAELADEVRRGEPARSLDLSGPRPRVRTADAEVTADALVVATGAHAHTPWPAAHTLHTWSDAQRLRAALGAPGRPARLVVVGAGWVGAEVAGVAAAAGHRVSVVESAAAPLPALGPVGARTAPWYAAAGVDLITGVGVRDVRADGATLDDGRELAADVVLAAVGVRPATGWAARTLPLDPSGALRTDADGAVLGPDDAAVPGVHAVGDVAVRRSARHGWVRGGHWDAALRGAEVVAAGLLGGQAPDPAPSVFSHQLGHDLALFGRPGGDDVVLREHRGGGWTAVWFAGPVVVAVLVVDAPREVGAARRLFRADTLPRLDRAAVADPDRPLR